jgi:hypothetical protein
MRSTELTDSPEFSSTVSERSVSLQIFFGLAGAEIVSLDWLSRTGCQSLSDESAAGRI